MMKRLHGYAIALLALVVLAGCASTPVPKSPEQSIAYAYATLATARTTAAQLVDSGRIAVEDGRRVQNLADQVRVGLDAAQTALKLGLDADAAAYLQTAQQLLVQLVTFVNTKGGGP